MFIRLPIYFLKYLVPSPPRGAWGPPARAREVPLRGPCSLGVGTSPSGLGSNVFKISYF